MTVAYQLEDAWHRLDEGDAVALCDRSGVAGSRLT